MILVPFREKTERIVICFFLLLLVILSLAFYKERIIFADTVDELRSMLRDGNVFVATNRYTSIFGQILPLAAYKLGLSLKTVVVAYSLNLILIPVACCLISMVWFRETKTAWSILLFYTIMNARLFYFPVSEFQIGLCFLLFYIGLYQHYLRKKISVYLFGILSVLFIPTIVFSHPLSVIVFGGWLVLQFFMNEKPWRPTIGIAIFTLITTVVKSLFYNIPYEADKKQGVERFKQFSLSYFDSPLANEFYKAIRQDYFLIPLLILVSVIALVRAKKYIASGLFCIIILALWALVTVNFMTEPYFYYTEHMYQPVTFFIALAVGRHLSLAIPPRVITFLFAIVLLISTNKIFVEREWFQRRLRWYEAAFELMDNKSIKKAMIGLDNHDLEWIKNNMWISVFESLILSSLEGPEHAKSITVVWNEETARSVIDQRNNLIGVALNFLPISELPPQYFQIGDSSYTMLSDVYTNQELRRLNYVKP